MDRSSRQKINKETWALNDTLDQMDLIDIYRAINLKTTKYTFFSSVPGTFFRIDHRVGHNVALVTLKKIEIISSKFPDHYAMRLKEACLHEIKRHLLLGRKADRPRQHIKKQRHYFVNEGLSSQGYGFSYGHV